ncbi:MAG TPA: thioesterase family protein [Acidimicrobiales bacterium]|nr:thioesterase family protein [Acidimicrobiales bacterium]
MTDGADLAWLGTERAGTGRWRFTLTTPLSRFDGKFYGGTGLAATTALMEAETQRRAVWATVQFAATADVGVEIECQVDVLAAGRTTSQVLVTGSTEEGLLFSALGATGEKRRGALEAQFGSPPAVPDPENCDSWRPAVPNVGGLNRGWLEGMDIRQVEGGMAFWMRLLDRPLTRAALGFMADVVPSGVVRAAGRAGAGRSLDNSIRFGPDPVGDWLLVDIDPHLIAGGYVSGAARLWARDGTLLGIASQSASLLLFD